MLFLKKTIIIIITGADIKNKKRLQEKKMTRAQVFTIDFTSNEIRYKSLRKRKYRNWLNQSTIES